MKLPKELREKRDLSGTANKARKCSVKGCGESAIRSLSENKWSKVCKKARLKFNENRLRKIFLCKKHYKEANRIRKSDEKSIQKKGFLEDSTSTKKGSWD